jgi:hypothetical protein
MPALKSRNVASFDNHRVTMHQCSSSTRGVLMYSHHRSQAAIGFPQSAGPHFCVKASVESLFLLQREGVPSSCRSCLLSESLCTCTCPRSKCIPWHTPQRRNRLRRVVCCGAILCMIIASSAFAHIDIPCPPPLPAFDSISFFESAAADARPIQRSAKRAIMWCLVFD